MMRTPHVLALVATTTLAAMVGCGAKKVTLPGNVGIPASAAPIPLPTLSRPSVDGSPLGVEEHVLLTVGDKTIGPFLARRGDALLAAYIGTSDEGVRRVVTVPLKPNGEPLGGARVVANVPADAGSLVVRSTGGDAPGFVLAWTALTDRGEALSVASVGDDGALRGTVVELARTNDDVVWIDLVPTARGAVAVWAEETRAGTANVLAAALGPDGVLRAVPNRVAHGVTGWQLVARKDGAALALSTPADKPEKADISGKKGKSLAASGSLAWLRLDVDARPVGPAAVLVTHAVSGDVDAAATRDGYVVAWTDRTEADPQVMLAAIDEAGTVRSARRAVEANNGTQLVAIAGSASGAVLAWEEPRSHARATKRVYFARVDATPAIDTDHVLSLELGGTGAPELVTTPDGFALLAPARACFEKDAAACAGAPVMPTLVRLDAKLAPTHIEPLRLGSVREPSVLGWGLTCTGDRCLALAATNESPARVRAVDLKRRATAWRPPLTLPPPPDAPFVGTVTTLGTGAFADLAAARVGDGALVALLTAALDEEESRKGPARGATLSVRPADAKRAGEAVTLTKRALTVGGVAMAAGGSADDGAAIAWVARESGDPEVHVTRVDARGQRVRDVQLTTQKGDASDVAIAWAGDGWIVAWVDGRDGNGEVYATKLDRNLRRVSHDERITRAVGDASDVTILARGDTVWLAWADPRESPAEGFADIYVAPIRASDAARAGDEVRILATAAHSRSPSLAASGAQLAVGWIEEAPLGADSTTSQAYGAMLAWLDPHGKPVRQPGHLPTAGEGFPTAITIDGTPASIHVVLARSTRDAIELDALEITRESSPRPFPLLGLDGPPSLDVAFVLAGDALYFNDEGQEAGDRRARRAAVTWRH